MDSQALEDAPARREPDVFALGFKERMWEQPAKGIDQAETAVSKNDSSLTVSRSDSDKRGLQAGLVEEMTKGRVFPGCNP